jgi:di/tricarboxylate transporter
MLLEMWELLALLLVLVYLLVSERLPVELAAFSVVLALVLLQILTPQEALSGLSSPTVVTLGAMFVLSAALRETGVAERLAKAALTIVGTSEWRAVWVVVFLSVSLSAFMSNVATVAILLPSVLGIAHRGKMPASLLLIPLSFGSLLGGMTTIIGSSPNLLAAQMLTEAGYQTFHFADFTPIGAGVALGGMLVILAGGWRLLPRTKNGAFLGGRDDLTKLYRLFERVFTLKVPPRSQIVGMTLESIKLGAELGAQVIAIVRAGKRRLAPHGSAKLEAGDTLVVAGRLSELKSLKEAAQLSADARTPLSELEILSDNVEAELESGEIGIVELLLAPRSSLAGRALRDTHFRERYGFQVLGIWREGRPIRTHLGEQVLQVGDALLVQGPRSRIATLSRDRDFVFLTESDPPVVRRYGAILTTVAFLLMVGLSVSGILEIEIATLLAAVLVLAARAVPLQFAYREIDWRILFFVAALLPIGIAVQRSGLGEMAAQSLVASGMFGSPFVVLLVLALVSSLVSQLLDGAPAVVLMAPVVFSLAESLQLRPQPLMLAVALGASIAFLSPFSHKAHLLVINSGGYQRQDYFRLGVWVSLATLITLLTLIWVMIPLR